MKINQDIMEINHKCFSQLLGSIRIIKKMYRSLFLILTIITLTLSCEQKRKELDQKKLEGKSLAELRIMRNEIFAKHGYIFQSQDLTEYFSNMDWYKPELKDVNHLLTKIDKTNIDFIIKQEALIKSALKSITDKKEQLSLAKFSMDSADTSQKELTRIFLNENKGQIVDDFNRFWGRDLGLKSYRFNIISQSFWTQSNQSIAIVKLEVKGKREKSSATAYNNYILNLNDGVELIYETDFFQPECGTPDITIKSISNLRIKEKNYPTLERESKKYPCCEQASEVQIDWLVFTNTFQNQPAILEQYFRNDNLMDCGPTNPPPPESRETNFFLEDSELTAEVIFLKGGDKVKSEKRKIVLNE